MAALSHRNYSILKEDTNEIEFTDQCNKYTRSKWCISCNKKGFVTALKFNGEMMRIHTATIIHRDHKCAIIKYDSENYSIVVKYFDHTNKYNAERNISKIIYKLSFLREKEDYAIVPSYYNDNCNKILMHYKDGDLLNLPSDWDKIKIFKDVLVAITRMAMKGLYYSDLKPANVLYSLEKNRIYLADLGGIIIGNDVHSSYAKYIRPKQEGVFTYPFFNGKHHSINDIEGGDVFGHPHFSRNFVQQILTFLVFCCDNISYQLLDWTSDNMNYFHDDALRSEICDSLPHNVNKKLFDKYFLRDDYVIENKDDLLDILNDLSKILERRRSYFPLSFKRSRKSKARGTRKK